MKEPKIEKCECQGGIDSAISYFIPAADLKVSDPFDFNEKGEIVRFNLKRKGTYRGKRFDRSFYKMPVPDLSSADAANIQAVKPGGAKRPKVKTVIENTKPEL